MAFKWGVMKAHFSTAAATFREWKTIEARRFAKVELPKVGEPIPKGFYIPQQKPEFPEYKYGESRIFKRSNKGLFGGKFIQFGNNVSEKSKTKTRRTWTVNDHMKKFWSEALNRTIRISVTTKVLRTITKEGGIDNYLTKEKSARIKELGPTGWKLRFRVLQALNRAPEAEKETVTKPDGLVATVHYTVGDKKVVVGKRRLLHALYGLELQSNTTKSFKEFMAENREKSVAEILDSLKSLNYDVSQVSV